MRLWLDKEATKAKIERFFRSKQSELGDFDHAFNQVFEAFVFASLVTWYDRQGWRVCIVNPRKAGALTGYVILKFSTRGRPENFSYAVCTKENETVEIRHQLRVATRYHIDGSEPPANVVLDVAVVTPEDLSGYGSDDFVPNRHLVTFGEAKHMSAFAELIAGFMGLVHEMMPDALDSRMHQNPVPDRHPWPFLHVSGALYPTARGLVETIRRRGCSIRVYDYASTDLFGEPVPTMPPQVAW